LKIALIEKCLKIVAAASYIYPNYVFDLSISPIF